MLKMLTRTYHRNKRFQEALPVYRFALRKWVWRGKKRLDPAGMRRYEIMKNVETLVELWEVRLNWLTRFFITPPDAEIKKVLSWE